MNRDAGWKFARPASRLRLAGILILVCGLGGAGVMYCRAQTASGRTMEDLMPGYVHARSRQRGILMGSFVAQLMDGFDALREPGTQAIVLAVLATIAGAGCFRVASMLGPDER